MGRIGKQVSLVSIMNYICNFFFYRKIGQKKKKFAKLTTIIVVESVCIDVFNIVKFVQN